MTVRKNTIVLFALMFLTSVSVAQKSRKLVWSDEFNGSGMPDTSKWGYETGYVRNKEVQYYTKRTENVRMEGGYLVIEARHDSLDLGNGNIAPVTAASIHTKGKGEWKYVRVEVRAKLPSSLGTWPAIWMLGKNSKAWPDCGEIDIMEHVGYSPDSIHTTVHTKAYNHRIGTHKGKATYIKNPNEDFHLYRVDWTKKELKFYIDNVEVFKFKNENKGVDEWPFDDPFYLLLNLAIGGGWGGKKGVDVNSLPQKFYVDYVRVYQ